MVWVQDDEFHAVWQSTGAAGPGFSCWAKEVFAGWYVIEADDIDAAIEIASRCPAARFGGSVEVRPVLEPRL